MTYSYDGWNYVVVLQMGESLVEGLQQFIKETDIKGAWLNGIGAALSAELGYYDLEKREYKWRSYDQACEIVSLGGNISRDKEGKPALHLHGALADEDGQTVGGHVRDLVVGGTCELFIHEFRQPLERQFDDETGLKLLDV
jgi:predicted DNA-binding protein with PD1-like motif